jgi:hypothetical protein
VSDFAQDEQLVLLELELGAGILGEKDLFALLDIGHDTLARVEDAARADSQDPALLGLFLGRVGQHDAAPGDLLALEGLDHDAVAQRAQIETRHGDASSSLLWWLY